MIYQKFSIYIITLLCVLTMLGLFTVKDSVMTLRAELQEVKKQLQNEEDSIRILKAELAYLASPERIQKLAKEHLALETPKVTQMIKDPLIENQVRNLNFTDVQSKNVKKAHKWRYKKGPTKYLTLTKGEK